MSNHTIVHNFISETERDNLLEWAYSQRPFLNPNTNGEHRFFSRVENLKENELIAELQLRLCGLLGIDYIEEPVLKTYLSFVEAGGFVHKHIDTYKSVEGYGHIRCNVMLNKPDGGGNPIIEEETIMVGNGDAWHFRPDLYEHYTDAVEGESPRIIISIGVLKKL